MDDDDHFSDYLSRQLARYPGFHHNSPLTVYPQRLVKEGYDSCEEVDRSSLIGKFIVALQELNMRFGENCTVNIDASVVYSYIFSLTTLENFDRKSKSIVGIHDQFMKVAYREVLVDLKAVEAAHPGAKGIQGDWSVLEHRTDDIIFPMATLISLRTFLVKVRNDVQQRHVSSCTDLSDPFFHSDLEIYIMRELLIIRSSTRPKELYLINYDQWLMLTDTVACRFMTRLACCVNDILGTDVLPDWKTISEIYKWGDEMLRAEGMAAYTVIGEFESFITGAFVTFQGADPLGLGKDFIESIFLTAEETYSAYNIPVLWTDRIMVILGKIASVNWLSEIFGLRKHWGNPIVDAVESGKAVQAKIIEDIPMSLHSMMKLLASFNRMITIEFIKQHGQWPECTFIKKEVSYPLYHAWITKSVRLPETKLGHDHLHWALLKFLPNILLNPYEDQMELLSDKSVSLHREYLNSTYVRNLCSSEFLIEAEGSRRLMLEFLRKKQHSVLDIFKVIMSGKTPISWLANSAAMKGTEMKHEKARIFAVLTFELRQYFTATEDIIKSEFFKYNPHQTMTMSEHELLRRLRQITRQMDPEGHSRTLSVVHIIDFSKWNLRMKYDNTCLVFKSMDDFLGTPGLIENTHILFSGMLNLVQDAFNPPPDGVENTESYTIWRNHMAGWEGQRQKGWTLLTSALLSDVERQTGIKSEICGQGDNQVLLSSFPIPDRHRNPSEWIMSDPTGVRDILDKFYSELEGECLNVGLKIKTAETCRSLYYLNYGKRLYFNGVELSMMLKRVSKSITEPNCTYPTTESLLKTEEGSSFSAGLYSHPSIIPYFLSRFNLLLNLYESFSNNPLVKDYGKSKVMQSGMELTGQFLSLLSKIPATLGGPPQLLLASYLYRGHPDPACADIVMLTLKARDGCRTSRRILTLMMEGSWFNKRHLEDKKSLIMSPYSLNLSLPRSALFPIQEALLPAIDDYCKNPDICDLFNSHMSTHEGDVCISLSKMDPFNPLVANDIFCRTLPGRRRALLSGLSNTTSLGRLIYESGLFPIISSVADLEMRQLDFWVKYVCKILRMREEDPNSWLLPHHNLVQRSREMSWMCNIVGVTVPHPLEQFMMIRVPYDVCCTDCERVRSEHLVMVRHSEDLVAPPGSDSFHVSVKRSRSGNPYLGNTINEGISQKAIYCLNATAPWIDAVRLNTVRQWVSDEGTYLDLYLKDLILTRTNVPIETLNLATGKPSRISYSHRAALMSVMRTCAVGSTSNMHSRIYISSNRMGEFSHGDYNYHMPFGPAFLLFESVVSLHEILSKSSSWETSARDVYHIHVRSADVPIVFDGLIDLTSPSVPVRRSLAIPRLLYCNVDDLTFSDGKFVYKSFFCTSLEDASTAQCREGYANQLIGSSLVSEVVVRETMTMSTYQHFIQNDVPISIGDLRLVGIKSLTTALAGNAYLMAPYIILFENDQYAFKTLVAQFLDALSMKFWSLFASALSTPANLTELYKEAAGRHSEKLTTSSMDSTVLLKFCVTEAMWLLHKNVGECVTTEGKTLLINLFVPTAEAARYCLSKMLEAMICRLCAYSNSTKIDAITICRDFSANMHSLDITYFSSIVTCIQREYELLKTKLGVLHCPRLPKVTIFDSQNAWLDRLLCDKVLPTEGGDPSVTYNKPLISAQPFCIEFLIPEKLLFVPSELCCCSGHKAARMYHEEYFFCPTGELSKIHYEFLDIVLSRCFPISSIISLYSHTGQEALAVAYYNECEKIYVHSHTQITSFSPHMAGSYMPSAFLGQPVSNKLVNSGKCAVAENDLCKHSGIEAVYNHVVGMLAEGMLVDLTSLGTSDLTLLLTCLENIITLVSRIDTMSWVIVKASFSCAHNCETMIGIMGRMFRVVELEWSLFSPPKCGDFFLIGKCRRDYMIQQISAISNHPLGLPDVSRISKLFQDVETLLHPGLAYVQSSIRYARFCISPIPESSLKQACASFSPGWSSHYDVEAKPEVLGIQIDSMIAAIEESAVDVVETATRVAVGDSMVRSSILMLHNGLVYSQLNALHELKNRLELLRLLLDREIIDLEEVRRVCDDWFSEAHSFSVNGKLFPLKIDITKFVDSYSRFLFEILGHCHDGRCTTLTATHKTGLFHRAEHLAYNTTPQDPLMYVNTKTQILEFDLRWKWQKRAEIMFLLLSVKKLKKVKLAFCSPHEFVIEDVLRAIPELQSKVNHIIGGRASAEVLDAIWINDLTLQDLNRLSLSAEFLVVCDIRMIEELNAIFQVDAYYHIPWMGLIPSEIVCHCKCRDKSLNQVLEIVYPDTLKMVNCTSEKGTSVIGCGCIDCLGECILIEDLSISHYALDAWCSLKTLENVRDVAH